MRRLIPGPARPHADKMHAIRRGFQMADRPSSDSEGEDFARMLEEASAPKFHREGETVQGTIVAIGGDVAFVDIGGKGEATIDIAELADPESGVRVEVGDTGQAVGGSAGGGPKAAARLARGAVAGEGVGARF